MTELAVAGATGLAGTKMLETLNRRNIPFDELVLFSSARSAGKEVESQGETYTVQELTDAHASEHFDRVLMSAGGGTSEHLAPLSEKGGAIVIDNSGQWRTAEDIDLIVSEVNEPTFTRGTIANPNCFTIQSIVPSEILQDAYDLKRVAYTIYQAVPGSEMKDRRGLTEGVSDKAPEAYPHPIYNNVSPHTDIFLENGYTREEQGMIDETRKVLNTPDLKVTATCIRAPVQNSHSAEIDITFEKGATAGDIKALFDQDDRVALVDNSENNEHPMTIDSANKDEIFVGRIHRDDPLENTFHVWCISNNLLKGAALNAVQVLEQVTHLRGAN